jgi:hypothetical protein
MQMDAGAARALSENGHTFGVPAQPRDVFLNPLQSSHLVFQTEVPWSCIIPSAQKSWKHFMEFVVKSSTLAL